MWASTSAEFARRPGGRRRDRLAWGASIGCWLALWQLVAMLVGQRLVLASPLEVALALGRLLPTVVFWAALGNSALRILAGLTLGAGLGALAGAAASRWSAASALLEPVMRVLRSVPVVSFVILVLIWSGPQTLTGAVVCAVVAPVAYASVREAHAARDRELVEVSDVFGARGFTRFRVLTWPALLPFLRAGGAVAIGLAWKAGVSAEVIGLPARTIGERLFAARLTLATDEVLAWTAVIVAASWLCERAATRLLRPGDH